MCLQTSVILHIHSKQNVENTNFCCHASPLFVKFLKPEFFDKSINAIVDLFFRNHYFSVIVHFIYLRVISHAFCGFLLHYMAVISNLLFKLDLKLKLLLFLPIAFIS